MLLPRRGLKKCIHAVSNFIALIPLRSIRQMEVNYCGFKFEKYLSNIKKRKSLSCVHVPHKTKMTYHIVFVLRIRRQLNSVPTYFLFRVVPILKCFSGKVFRTVVSSAVVVLKISKNDQSASLNCSRLKVTRTSYFVRVPSYFEALWYPHLYFDGVSLTYSMDNKQINQQYSIKCLAIGVNVTWLQCHASLGSESIFCCCLHFLVKISRLHIVRILALNRVSPKSQRPNARNSAVSKFRSQFMRK